MAEIKSDIGQTPPEAHQVDGHLQPGLSPSGSRNSGGCR
jgi:hypothetical protein